MGMHSGAAAVEDNADAPHRIKTRATTGSGSPRLEIHPRDLEAASGGSSTSLSSVVAKL